MKDFEKYIELFGWEVGLEEVEDKSDNNDTVYRIVNRIGIYNEISILAFGDDETPYLLESKDEGEYKYCIGGFESDGRFISVIDWISPFSESLIKLVHTEKEEK